MSKINYAELKELLDSGKSQRECSRHFGVSDAAICKAVRRLRALDVPDSFKKLTDRKRTFVAALAEGKSKTAAAIDAFECSTLDSAKALGSTMSKDPDIEKALVDLMAQEGITRRRRIQRLRDLIESPDLNAVSRGLDMSWKLDGAYAPGQIEIVDHRELSERLADLTRKMREAGLLTKIVDVTPIQEE